MAGAIPYIEDRDESFMLPLTRYAIHFAETFSDLINDPSAGGPDGHQFAGSRCAPFHTDGDTRGEAQDHAC